MGFKLGQSVYLKTDPQQLEGIVVGKSEFVGGSVVYKVGWNGSYVDVYEVELTGEEDTLKKVTNYEP